MTSNFTNLTQIRFPAKFEPFLQPSHCRVVYGGRGGGRSLCVAKALLIEGMGQPKKIVCIRRDFETIENTVFRLLADLIEELGLQGFYTIGPDSIHGRNGTEIAFSGVSKHLEGIDICWVECAEELSDYDWCVVLCTMRDELWVTFNVTTTKNSAYHRFVTAPPKNGATIINLNWRDNPDIPQVLREQFAAMALSDPARYLNEIEGVPVVE